MYKHLIIFFLLFSITPLYAAQAVSKQLMVDGTKRWYLLYVPDNIVKDKRVPLLLVFHGGGSTPKAQQRQLGFDRQADRDGFIVVYPEAIGRNWNDGRESDATSSHRDAVNDLAFITALIDRLSEDYAIDPKRIYATGISNGAMMSHYLAMHMAKRIAAIAPVVGGLAAPQAARFKPNDPVAVLIIQGTEDPLVPYAGGAIAKKHGTIISTDDAVKKWVDANACEAQPKTEHWPDRDPQDGCRVTAYTWDSCRAGTKVKLLKLEGAGHTWPNGTQYLPQSWIGKVCRDFDGNEVIWEFFKNHPKP